MSLSISVSAPVMTRFTCLSCSRRDLADDARELVEDLAERHHAHLEDAVLHLRRGGARTMRWRRCRSAASSRRARGRARTRSDEARERRCARSRARRRCSSGGRACGCRRAPSASTLRSVSSRCCVRARRFGRRAGGPGSPAERARRAGGAGGIDGAGGATSATRRALRVDRVERAPPEVAACERRRRRRRRRPAAAACSRRGRRRRDADLLDADVRPATAPRARRAPRGWRRGCRARSLSASPPSPVGR